MLRRLILCGALLILLPATGGWAADYGFRVLRAEMVHENHRYGLRADIDFRFSDPAIDALQHGVPLTLLVHLKVQRHRDYWLDETAVNDVQRLYIRYHPLAKSFRLAYDSGASPQDYFSLAGLLEALGRVRDWPLIPEDTFVPGEEYWATLSADLDIEALPLPLRPIAYVSPSWYLGSPKFRWRVAD